MVKESMAGRKFILRVAILWTALITITHMLLIPCKAQTTDLVNGPVNPAGHVLLLGQHAPWATEQNRRGLIPGDTQLEHLTLLLKRSPEKQQAFERFLRELQDRSSSNYHHFLTPVQVGTKFGASQTDIGAAAAWLRSQGLRVNSIANSRMMIDFSGNVSQIDTAFVTEMSYYEVAGERRMGPCQRSADSSKIVRSHSGCQRSEYRQ